MVQTKVTLIVFIVFPPCKKVDVVENPTETGFYYLQSRYYDPETGRFINADGLVSTGQGLGGTNMFAYCGNNPINFCDPTGEFFSLAIAIEAQITGYAPPPSITFTIPNIPIYPYCPFVPIIVPNSSSWRIPMANPATSQSASIPKSSNVKASVADERNANPPAARKTYSTRKAAKEAAKKAGGGKDPRHNPNGHPDDPRPHFHPKVPNAYSRTPKQPNFHDHYYYPKGKGITPIIPELLIIGWDML